MNTTRNELRTRAQAALRDGLDVSMAAGTFLALLDQLDTAEARIARLEAQSAIRGRAVVMYRERAREAERLACSDRDVHWRYVEEIDACQERADQAEARIKAVRDIHTGTRWPGVTDKPICDACDQPWPCLTIRALDS